MASDTESKKAGYSGVATTEVFVEESGEAQVGCLLYVSQAGPEDQGRTFRLIAGEMVIGRGEVCDLALDHSSVSRRHAKLSVTRTGILVEDLGSTNGISYLGKRIERATLDVGARLGIGSCTIDLLPLSDATAMPLSTAEGYGALVGASLPMRKLYASLERLEKSDAPVLIEGETGTGKELVARALHDQGLRAGKPFVLIDCGSVPANLMESELFGHRKGAFTGAVADRAGAFETANGGTVFLDELGELPLELQPKLLRVLETGQVKRLGDVQHVPVDVRILAATKRNLSEMVAQGTFREDLFYRVAVVRLVIPPLRTRRDDIKLLAHHLSSQLSDSQVTTLPREAEELFMHHDWPGNVRELRNVVQGMLALGTVAIAPATPAARTGASVPAIEPGGELPGFRDARKEIIESFERTYLQELLDQHKGNLSAAARAAGVDRKHLRKLLKKYGLYEG